MNKKRWLSVLLCFALVLSLMPTTAFAVGNEPAAEATCTQSTDCQAELHTEGCPAALPVAASEPPESPPETTAAFTEPEETFTEPVETTAEPTEPPAEPTQPPEQPTEPTGEFTEPTEAPTEATEEPTGADELTPAQRVQAMIDALPDADSLTEETAEELKAQLTAIDDAKVNLTDEELDTLDITRYQAAVSALLALEDMAGANEPELLIDNVSYLDCDTNGQNWQTKTASCTAVTASTTTLNAGWYVVNSDVTISSRITVSGEVHLILCDGKTLTASQGIGVNTKTSLFIYAQSTGTNMGKLVAQGGYEQAGIGGDNAVVIINGGYINATGGYFGAGIGGDRGISGGTVFINGGYVNATGGFGAAGIGGGYYGGSIEITINGGTVEARAGEAHNRALGDGEYNYDGCYPNLGSPSSPKVWYVIVSSVRDECILEDYNNSPFASAQTSVMFNNTHYAKIYQGMPPVHYLDAGGANQECTDYALLTNQTTLNTGWYVVDSNVTTSSRITVSGDVHLILVDGTTLNSAGINIDSGNSLTIYAQSTGSSMGKLVATTTSEQEAGITCNGTLTINGGDITATGRQYGAGIGGKNAYAGSGQRDPRGSCGTVIINGGIVKAFGTENAAGIGGGQNGNGGTVIINGGTVEATAGPNGPHAIGMGSGASSNGSLKIGTPGSGNYWYVKGGADSSNQQNVSGSPFAAAQENIVTNVSGKKYVRIYQNVAPLPYIEADGTTGGCDEYTVLTNQTNLTSGWYVVNSNVTLSERITVSGNVHLILADGGTLNANQGIAVLDPNSLSIYWQSGKTGALNANNPSGGGAAIGGSKNGTSGTAAGTIVINGGNITANVTSNGGACIGQSGWSGAGGTVTVNNGYLKLHSTAGNEGAFGSDTTRTINGGIIEYTSTTTYDTITGSTMNNCIVFNNSDTGTVYGDPTVDFDYTMDSGKTITVGSNQTLTVTSGFTLTNNGTIHANGTLHYGEPTYGTITGGGSIIGTFDFGDFKVTGDISKVSYASNTLTILDGADVTITMRDDVTTTTNDRILVASGATANITLAGVNIDMSGKNNTTAFMIEGSSANATITLETGTTNTLKSGNSCPGLGVKTGSTVTIKGDGALESTGGGNGAGIGGGHTFNAGTINIESGTITATGGYDGAGIGGGHSNDNQSNQYGLFDNIHITGGVIHAHSPGNAAAIGTGCWAKTCPGTITIENAKVTATTDGSHKRCAAIGRGISKDDSNYDCAVTIKNSIVSAQNVAGKGNTISGTGGTPDIQNSIVKVNAGSSHDNAYAVYGSYTLSESWTVPTGTSLFIDSGSALTVGSGATLTNSGSIYVDGTLTGSVAGSVYYPLTVTGGEASPTVTQNGKTYAKAGDTITLTAEDKVGQTVSWKLNNEALSGNTFTMPSKAATVSTEYINAPTYTVTIPASVEVNSTATVSASGVNVASGSTLTVKIDNSTSFVMENAEHATLNYAVHKGNERGDLLNQGDNILEIPGGEKDALASAVLAFTLASGEIEKYSGVYEGKIIFHVSLTNATP